jgi:hypothetical protein
MGEAKEWSGRDKINLGRRELNPMSARTKEKNYSALKLGSQM